MAIYGYTKNYKLIKPQFNTDTWHDYIYDNLDTIDAVMSAIYASGNWKGFWAKNMTYVTGDVIIDQDTDTMYKVMIDHVTSADTFAAEQTAHPDYYELWSPNNLAESWAIKTDGKVSNTDYSAKAYAISSGLIDDGSAKEWAVGSGAIGNTNEYSAKKYATDAHNDYISMTTNVNVVAVGSNINNVNAVGQSISNVNTVAGDISSVNVAATNIEFIKAAEGNANDAKNSKIEAQNSAVTAQLMATQAQDWATKTDGKVDGTNYSSKYYAGQASNSANNSHIWAEGTDAQVQALGGVHSSKVWAEQSTNANIALTNSPYTTNRILEIPQDIKLELNNGTLTLKAGSKVYVPNGSGNFDVITTTQDYAADTSSYSGLYVLGISTTTGLPNGITTIQDCVSGGTAPSSPTSLQGWYDTTNNVIRRYSGDSIQTTFTCSFPLCSVTSNGTNITSIDQVFNGFGYIGSTVFVLPGVKVQIPNGRNEDGTYKVIPYTTQNVITREVTGIGVKDITLQPNGILNWATGGLYFAEDGYHHGYIVNSINVSAVLARVLITTAGKIDNFVPRTVDSVANSNASNFSQAGRSYLSGLGMPSNRYIDLTLGASGSTYTAPANGWFRLVKKSTSVGQSIQFNPVELYRGRENSDAWIYQFSSIANQTLTITLPVLKGQKTWCYYNAGGDTVVFEFIYAEGEN